MSEPTLVGLFVRPLEALGIPYLVSGGVAAVIYGEPRLTRDIDLVVALRASDAERFADAWPADEFYVPPLEVIREECERSAHGHFNVIHNETALRADVYLPGESPLNAWAFQRPVVRHVDGVDVRVAPLEAVIINKLHYYKLGGSDRHLRDIRQMLTVSGEQLDRAAVDQWTNALGLTTQWRTAQTFDVES